MTLIEGNPHLYPVVHKGVLRRALIKCFPYGVFFVEGERSVSVIAVAHAKSGTHEFGKNGADIKRAEKFANQTLPPDA